MGPQRFTFMFGKKNSSQNNGKIFRRNFCFHFSSVWLCHECDIKKLLVGGATSLWPKTGKNDPHKNKKTHSLSSLSFSGVMCAGDMPSAPFEIIKIGKVRVSSAAYKILHRERHSSMHCINSWAYYRFEIGTIVFRAVIVCHDTTLRVENRANKPEWKQTSSGTKGFRNI